MSLSPDFYEDLALGSASGEQYVQHVVGPALLAGELQAEVKYKRREDGLFYIETEQNARNRGHWVPGGINQTSARFYCFVIGTTGVVLVLPSERVKEAVQ